MNSKTGVIGQSGKWYGCERTEHIQTMLKHKDWPYVIVYPDDALFEAYYTVDRSKPTKAQFETLMNYCTTFGKRFEDITDCWDLPWQDWREQNE